jgi:hypothetical protein
LAVCSELVDELQHLAQLERRRDPTDGRAKLTFPPHAAATCSIPPVADEFNPACRTLNASLHALENERRAQRSPDR